MSVPFARLVTGVETKKVRYRFSKAMANPFQFLE